jgi:hypothetical protein
MTSAGAVTAASTTRSVKGTALGSARNARETGVPASVLARRLHQNCTAGWVLAEMGSP